LSLLLAPASVRPPFEIRLPRLASADLTIVNVSCRPGLHRHGGADLDVVVEWFSSMIVAFLMIASSV
jgi:hypothetical protein